MNHKNEKVRAKSLKEKMISPKIVINDEIVNKKWVKSYQRKETTPK